MPTKRLAGLTQSNGIRLNGAAYDQHMVATLIPILQAMIDPTAAEVTVDRLYDAVNGYPGFTGTGTVFDNNTMTKGANFYSHANEDYFFQPTDPADPEWNNFLSWPASTRQTTVETWMTGTVPTQLAEVGAFYIFHSEYDSQAPGVNAWIRDDPRVLERGWRRRIDRMRTVCSKTAAQTPLLLVGPILFSSGSNEGFELVREAFERLAQDSSLNAFWVNEASLDFEWDGDSPGSYGSHATPADMQLAARRLAPAFARVLGPRWAPNSYAAGRHYPGSNPRIGWAQRTSDTNIRCFIQHEGGSDFTLPGSPLASWKCFYGGHGLREIASIANQQVISVSAVTKVDYRTIDVTLGSACPVAEGLRICYGWGNSRLQTGNAIYDNRDGVAWTNRVLPSNVTGSDRIKGALARTPARGLAVSNDPPPLWAIGPALV